MDRSVRDGVARVMEHIGVWWAERFTAIVKKTRETREIDDFDRFSIFLSAKVKPSGNIEFLTYDG